MPLWEIFNKRSGINNWSLQQSIKQFEFHCGNISGNLINGERTVRFHCFSLEIRLSTLI